MGIEAWDHLFYPGYADNWDDTLFRKQILSHLKPQDVVLDLGAGSGLVKQMNFRGICSAVYGLDPNCEVLSNPYLDIARVGTGENIPWPNNTFDVIVADNVLEHLPQPEKVFAEICRVLKPGGVFLAKTPNRFHYVTIISQLTPTSFHQFINRMRGRKNADTFPTRYRANSQSRLRTLGCRCGMTVVNIEHIEGRPEYMRLSQVLYLLGMVWERVVNSMSALRCLRVLLIVTFRKNDLVARERSDAS